MTAALSDLIARLAAASEGSRELDGLIAEHVGWQRDDARNFVWRSPDGQAFHVPPAFSRSLDAELPGENIVQVKLLALAGPLGDRWQADNLAFDGSIRTGYAQTEAIARRLAALYARAT